MLVTDFFDLQFKHLKFDAKLASEIYKYQIYLTTKNEDHMLFFGGGLTGCYSLATSVNDVNYLFKDILDSDYLEINRSLEEIDDIKLEFSVGSDLFNLTIMYLLHKFINSPLDQKKKDRVLFDLILILQYKLTTGVIKKYFKYQTDVKTATATFDALSNQFILKKLGTWQNYFNYKARHAIDEGKVILVAKKFDDITAIMIKINDFYNGINDMVKNIYNIFIGIANRKEKLATRKDTYESENGEQVADLNNKVIDFQEKAISAFKDLDRITSRHEYKLVLDVNKSIEVRFMSKLLIHVSNDLLTQRVEDFIRNTVIIITEYFKEHRYLNSNIDASGFITDLKFSLLKTRNKEDPLEKLKEEILKYIIEKNLGISKGRENRYALGLMMLITLFAVL